jgi:heme O synthase-like polyprenyltransferase
MAGKEIDRGRAQGAMAVVRQHPGMVLFVVSPAIVALGVVWGLAGAGWAALLLVALVLAGGAGLYSLVSKRR